jgi:hypothetical protein
MRRQEIEMLQAPYQGTPDDGPDRPFRERLGTRVPAVERLAQEILADLDPNAFGVGWWSGYPELGDKRRILIGDYLYQSAESIEPNIAEAKIHLFEVLDCWEKQDRLMADAIVPDPATGQPRIVAPRHASPTDMLPVVLATMHVAGFMRAINSAIDCLGAVLLGVAALPRPIIRTDFRDARTSLRDRRTNTDDARDVLTALARSIDEAVTRAGPTGWLEWVTNYRHMLVHRGRRVSGGEVVPREPDPDRALAGPDGRPLMRGRVIPFLAREPAWSEIDVFRAREAAWLGEHGAQTLHGILESTVSLLGEVAAALTDLWRRRRTSPELLVQPTAQWPRTELPARTGFVGYSGKAELSPDHVTVPESMVHRLRAAALATTDAHRWETFT